MVDVVLINARKAIIYLFMFYITKLSSSSENTASKGMMVTEL